ncbi:Lsr2 family protein [Streptomyces sp. NBC_00440]|uniref:histone-like nucleoid-structuring protein Lsr2 n=1 Tax=Streptomyces sp. NBC_00440 TaxID=2975741 RepID=UPI002E1E1B61
MAQRVIRTLVDDVTGEESEEIGTHTILIDGAGVEIDLTPGSHDQLMDALRPFLHADGARRVRGGSATPAGKGKSRPIATGARRDAAQIREWAKENGFEVNDRGRVPAPVREAYDKARG